MQVNIEVKDNPPRFNVVITGHMQSGSTWNDGRPIKTVEEADTAARSVAARLLHKALDDLYQKM